jgi:hypothetical protein
MPTRAGWPNPMRMDEGELAETVAMLLNGELGDPARYVELHGWTVVGLDIGEIEIKTRNDGAYRLSVVAEEDA